MIKRLLAVALVLAFSGQAWADTIARPTKSFGGTTWINNVVPTASDFNGDIDTIYSDYNGNIANVNIKAGAAIVGSKITPAFTSSISTTVSGDSCVQVIDSSQVADAKRWDMCTSATTWVLRTKTDAGVTTITPISINRATGAVTFLGAPTYSALSASTLLALDASKVVINYAGATACTNQFMTGFSAAGASTCSTATLAGAQFANQGTTTTLLHGNGAGNPSFGAVVSADLNLTTTSCTNQFVTALSSAAAGTCTTATLAGAQFANQGTTTTVLHGNAAGNPAFGAIVDGDITANTIALGKIATSGANTMLGNWTGSTASVAANAMPSCADSGGNHLNYVAGTGVTCGTSSGAVTGTITAGTSVTKSPYAASTYTTAAHGLGATPTFVSCYLENLTAELNYSIGDRIPVAAINGFNSCCFSMGSNATDVWISISNDGAGSAFSIINKTAPAGVATITYADWKLVCTPYLKS